MKAAGKNIEDIYPLTPAQHGMLFHTLYEPAGDVYFTQLCSEIEIEDIARFEQAWQHVIDRHPVLRTALIWKNLDEPLQAVGRRVRLPVTHHDWRGLSVETREEKLQALLGEDRQRGFKLSRAPLLRLTVLRIDERNYTTIVSFHHIVLDGWSLQLVLKEVAAYYAVGDREEGFEREPCRPFAEYVKWLRCQNLDEAERYWRRTLAGFCAPTVLNLDGCGNTPGNEKQTHAVHRIRLSVEAGQALQSFVRAHHLTVNTVVQGAWALLLGYYSGQDDVVLGVTVSGRPPDLRGVERMVGMFINVLPMRVKILAGDTVVQWLQGLQSQQAKLRAFESTPLSQVHRWSDVPQGQALFESMLVFENQPSTQSSTRSGGASGLRLKSSRSLEKTNYPMTLVAVPGDRPSLQLGYDPHRFSAESMARMLGHLDHILAELVQHPSSRLSKIQCVTQSERHQLLVDWNSTRVDFSESGCLHELLELQVERSPDAIAVAFETERLTYRELNERANQVAHHLRRRGVVPDALVAVYLERSLDMVVGLLGVLKAGGAYVPLDPSHPRGRLKYMLDDSKACVLLMHNGLSDLPSGYEAKTICLSRDKEAIEQSSRDNPIHTTTLNDLAYVIYTSGSTGRPKGVMIPHRAICNHMHWMNRAFPLDEQDKVLQRTPYGFDASVWEFYAPLLSGAQLIVSSRQAAMDPAELVATIVKHEITTLQVVPALLRAILDVAEVGEASCLKRVFCGGEVLPTALCQRFRALVGAELHNLYGPTEATIDATVFSRTDDHLDRPTVPIGRPIANVETYVVDRHMNPLPVGVAGELFIGGTGLSRGYLNREALTAEKFIAHPFSDDPEERVYRTGDVVRYLPDGQLEFIERLDHQVKIRGYRIELGEIEAVLDRHPQIRSSAVLAREDTPGDRRLVAYVVSKGESRPSVAALRSYLQDGLPDYMIPAVFVTLDALPLQTNGKVDRKILPKPDGGRPDLEQLFVAPETHEEKIFAGIWCDVLGVDRVGMHDNFFQLGGDSILSLTIVSRANQAGLHITPKNVFDHPTVAGVLTVVNAEKTVVAEQGPVVGAVPMTPIQRDFLDLVQGRPDHFNQAVFLAAREDIRVDLLCRAFQALQVHHDALRLRGWPAKDGWTQELRAPDETTSLSTLDLNGVPAALLRSEMETRAGELQASLCLESGPVIRAVLFNCGERESTRLLIVAHHFVVDGLSWRVLLEDLQSAYKQLLAGKPVGLPPKTTSIREWAARLERYAGSDMLRNELTFWRNRAGIRSRPLPRDHADELSPNVIGDARAVTVSLSAEQTEALLRRVPEAYNTRINDVLLTAVVRTLEKWTGEPSQRIDLEGHGREDLFDDVDVSRTVGWFTSSYPVALQATHQESVGAALMRIKEQLRAVPNGGFGWGVLRWLHADSAVRNEFGANPDAEIGFNYLGQFDQTFSEEGVFTRAQESSGPTSSPQNPRRHLLDIHGVVSGGKLRVNWLYAGRVFDRDTIQNVADGFIEQLCGLIDHCVSGRVGRATPSDFPLAQVDQETLDRLQKAYGKYRIEDMYPLSPLQQGMLYHTLSDPASTVFVNQFTYGLRGELHLDKLRDAWRRAMKRHTILRTAFVLHESDRMKQVVLDGIDVPWKELDWSEKSSDVQERELDEFLVEDRRQGFDLHVAPLFRLTLIRRTNDRYQIVLTHHHSILDGWSFPLLLREVASIYGSFCDGEDVKLGSTRPYRDYISWLERQDVAAAEAFWRENLAGFTSITAIPCDRNAGAEPDGFASRQTRLTTDESKALQSLARNHQVTLNTVVQGAWAVLLARYCGRQDVVYGATISGRPAELDGVADMVGVFINTLPVRVRLTQDDLGTWLRDLQARQAEMRQFEFSPLYEVQTWSEVGGGTPLFENIFVFENYPVDVNRAPSRRGRDQVDSIRGFEQANYPLAVVVKPGAALTLQMHFHGNRFTESTIDRLLAHFRKLLQSMISDPHAAPSSLDPLSESERRMLLIERNDTARSYQSNTCIHHLFEQQVPRFPNALAVVDARTQMTYDHVNRRANQLAHHLVSLGVGAETLVAVLMNRSCDLIVALLGVLKAGGAYVPLDPLYPADRLSFMIKDAGATVLLTQHDLVGVIDNTQDLTKICLGTEGSSIATCSQSNPVDRVTPKNLAYVIYTSGSTGEPKGVEIEHQSLMNLVSWHQEAYGTSPTDRATQLASPSFDASVWEIWPYLGAGASIHIPAEDVRAEPSQLVDWLARERISVCFMPTPLAEACLREAKWPEEMALRALLTGGDKLHSAPNEALPFELINHYGPTESTVVATCCPVVIGSVGPPPIGRPIANTQVYLLDEHLRLVPPGAVGEIYIGGSSLARGYHRRSELSAQRFPANPFDDTTGDRLYRTGDAARYLPDGNLEFLGRLDRQVKIRGYRIELGEIEATLSGHTQVRETAVVAWEDIDGPTRLVAYVVAEPEGMPAAEEMARFLKTSLPDYMVPADYVPLDEIPRTPNGKLDRKALPAVPRPESDDNSSLAPRDQVQDLLAGIWADVLGLAHVGVEENFFDLGGHSLLATQLISRIRDVFGVEMPLRDLFDAPTVSGLSRRVSRARACSTSLESAGIGRVPRNGDTPLSLAQQRMWFISKFGSNQTQYNISLALRLSGSLSVDVLERTIAEVVCRHEILRTSFPLVDGDPVQRIGPDDEFVLNKVVLPFLPEEDQAERIEKLISAERRYPFDLENGPLLRATLIRKSDEVQILILAMHHIISDGWSVGVLSRELSLLFKAYGAGEPSPLAELPIQYADYAAWQHQWLQGSVLDAQVKYWKRQLAAVSVLQLPTDHMRPPQQSFRGARESLMLPKSVFDGVQALARERGVTPFMVLLAVFKILLSRYAAQHDIAVGTPIAGRTHSQVENLIGFFVNTLVLRTDLSNNPDFLELMQRVKGTTLDAYAHQDLPFDKLVDILQPERDPSRNPIFQVLFALQNLPRTTAELPGLRMSREVQQSETSRFDLEWHVLQGADRFYTVCSYSTDLFDGPTVARMLQQFLTMLEAVLADPRKRISDLDILSDSERKQLLDFGTRESGGLVPESCVHELFELQAERRPDAEAIVYRDRGMSYGALNAQSNRLAHYLRELDVGPGVLVGICLDRGLDLIVTILGVLKAGAAYVPLDPEYPPERLAMMVRDTEMPLVITAHDLLKNLQRVATSESKNSSRDPRVICFDGISTELSGCSAKNPVHQTTADDLVYVMYTSGSTGVPKGVEVPHRGVVRLICGVDYVALGQDETVLQLAPISFDASTLEIWGPLLHGGRLVLYPERVPDLQKLGDVLRHYEVTTMWLTSSLYNTIIDSDPNALAGLRQLLIGGEALSVPHVQRGIERLPNTQIINGYGPTESTTFACCYKIPRGLDPQVPGVPIGRPISRTQVFILDEHMRPVPVGVPGELYIGGDGLARGYHNDPGLTARRFVPSPFGSLSSARIYKTGDRARWLSTGLIEFLGRLDEQVKVRGYRIEPGEIEARLLEHPWVRSAAVVLREYAPGDSRLVAYVVTTSETASSNDALDPSPGQIELVGQLRDLARQSLPEFMVPAAIVILNELPLTPSGKLDKTALPHPDAERLVTEEFEAPATAGECAVAQIWQEVLAIEQAGMHDNFFDLGGHSLLLAKVHTRLQEIFPCDIGIIDLFRYPTIHSLAKFLSSESDHDGGTDREKQRSEERRAKQIQAGKDRIKQRLKRAAKPRLGGGVE